MTVISLADDISPDDRYFWVLTDISTVDDRYIYSFWRISLKLIADISTADRYLLTQ
jgi:hypothetical protein